MSWGPEETARHVEAVRARVALAAPDDLRDLVDGIVRIHEERDPDRVGDRARALGIDDEVVATVVLAFGEVWSMEGDDGLDHYVSRNRDVLRPLLLLELAHEGAATDAMREAAARGGIGDEFAEWARALAD